MRKPILWVLVALYLTQIVPLSAQSTSKIAKYGADFLAGGVDARALAMGNTQIALSNNVASGYWNPAGLANLSNPDLMYMHAERFSGVVSFDYMGAAFPINKRSIFGVSAIRSGVNDIKDTRDAWDFERDTPKPNPENYFKTFSQADYALFLSYARKASENLQWGTSAKIVRRKIGNYADAFGYSFDAGMQYQKNNLKLGAMVMDVTTMLQSWSINTTEFEQYKDQYGVPTGGSQLVLPVVRLGAGYTKALGKGNKASSLTLGFDTDLSFDGQQKYAFNAGNIGIHPRVGMEYSMKDKLALRLGMNHISQGEDGGIAFRPTVGIGFKIRQVSLDYAFGDFAGLTSELGNSHILSLRLSLEK